MRVRAVAVLSILIGAGHCYAQAVPYREKSKLMSADEAAEVTIEIANTTLRRNGNYTAKYTFRALNSYRVFNWQFIGLMPLPGQLVIYDKDKKYIGDLIAFTEGSRVSGSGDPTFLYEGSSVGRPLNFRAGYVPHTLNNSGSTLVPAGTYYIQLVLYRAFLTGGNWGRIDTSEQYRSNTIKVELVD
jgi:hypothetical protein